MAEVKLANIRKVYQDGFEAVKGISCDIHDKEFVVLVGPSGCGKSTVLRMIAGLEDISSGTLHIGESLVNDIPPSERGISMVFQNYALYPHMNAYDNMAFGLKIKKLPKDEIDSRVRSVADILDIEDLLDKKPGKMSGGQRQRIAIGRAIVRRPDVFLFDEPLSNLDAKLRSKMRVELAKLHKRLDATMIYVTHDQVEAMTLGQRIIVMNKGEIMQISAPIELFNNPHNRFVAGFIGTPQMNFIEGVVESKNNNPFFKSADGLLFDMADLPVNDIMEYIGKPVSMGIRSENIRWEQEKMKHFVSLTGSVDAIEVLGNHKLVHLSYNNTEFVSKLRSEIETDINSDIELHFNLEKAYFFDSETGQRIY